MSKIKLNKDLKIFYKTVLFSRIIIISIICLTIAVSLLVNDSNIGACINNTCRINFFNLFTNLDQIARGDIDWYKSVALEGYTKEEFNLDIKNIIENRLWITQKNWAFFPAWPSVWKFISIGSMNIYIGTLLANIFFMLGVFIMGLYIKSISSSKVKYSFYLIAAFYPFSYFYSLPLPESLFFFLFSLYIYSISSAINKQRSFYTTIISGVLCGLTRQFSVFLSFFAISEFFKLKDKNKLSKQNITKIILAFISPYIGLSIFMRIILNATGNPFSFINIQLAWRRFPEFPFAAFFESITSKNFGLIVYRSDNFLIANQIIFILGIVSAVILFLKGISSFKISNVSYDYIVISISLFLALLSTSSDSAMLGSLNRIVGCNPIFVLALSLAISPKIIKASIPLQIILLGSFTTFCALGIKPFYY